VHRISCFVRRAGIAAGLAAAAFLIAGCHGYNRGNTSGYGVAWVTLGTVPSPIFTSYVVTVDSVILTDTLGRTVTALATPEPVDFVKLRDYRELWGSAFTPNTVGPDGVTLVAYKSATIVLDYSHAEISVLVNGLAQRAAIIGPSGTAATTVNVHIDLDPAHQLVIKPSYSTDNAQMLAINFDLPASNEVVLATNPATVIVNPFLTAALAPPDRELIRVRGTLVNSSVPIGTFTISERPFYEQAASTGTLTIFNSPATLYTVDGSPYAGTTGLNTLSQLPAGLTMTSSYTTFEPTPTATAFAGKFNSVYTIAGGSVQSLQAENISGDVIAISTNSTTGVNTLTLRGSTIYGPLFSLAEGYFGYQNFDSTLLVGPSTLVSIDNNATTTGVDYKSISVGAHVEALGFASCLGTCNIAGTGTWTIDATGSSTGRVRLLQSQIFGRLLSATSTSLSMALQTINYWPASDFSFAGTGATSATNSSAANYQVSTAAANLIAVAPTSPPAPLVPADLSAAPAGTPLIIGGTANAFGSAPPDFLATTVYEQPGVPAQLRVSWAAAGTITPFANLANNSSGACCVFSIDLQDASLSSATLQVGPQSIALNSLSASPLITATLAPVSITAEPIFSPHYAYGVVAIVGGIASMHASVFTDFRSYVNNFVAAISASTPALELTANGYYDPGTNTFTANTVSVVL
jgi:hypothetical protein